MTPIEKAMELIEKFEKQVYKYDLDTNDKYDMSLFHLAKQCALIAVDEIIKYAQNAYHNEDIIKGAKLYWNQVKHEIEKL